MACEASEKEKGENSMTSVWRMGEFTIYRWL